MGLLEDITDKMHHGYFVDLFVRVSNAVAMNMYNKARSEERGSDATCSGHLTTPMHALQFGYTVYRRVIGYYSNEEDAYGA